MSARNPLGYAVVYDCVLKPARTTILHSQTLGITFYDHRSCVDGIGAVRSISAWRRGGGGGFATTKTLIWENFTKP